MWLQAQKGWLKARCLMFWYKGQETGCWLRWLAKLRSVWPANWIVKLDKTRIFEPRLANTTLIRASFGVRLCFLTNTNRSGRRSLKGPPSDAAWLKGCRAQALLSLKNYFEIWNGLTEQLQWCAMQDVKFQPVAWVNFKRPVGREGLRHGREFPEGTSATLIFVFFSLFQLVCWAVHREAQLAIVDEQVAKVPLVGSHGDSELSEFGSESSEVIFWQAWDVAKKYQAWSWPRTRDSDQRREWVETCWNISKDVKNVIYNVKKHPTCSRLLVDMPLTSISCF